MAKNDHISAVRKLSRQFPQPDELRAAFAGLRPHAERGAAVVAAAQLDFALMVALCAKLKPLTQDEYESMFGEGGPLSTTNNKIRVAYALDIIGKKSKKEIKLIQLIRNAFAHATVPINFKTEAIAKCCDSLDTMAVFPEYKNMKKFSKKDFPWKSSKSKYTTSIQIYAEELLKYYEETKHGKTEIREGLISHMFTRSDSLP